jgi:hypothetical protein
MRHLHLIQSDLVLLYRKSISVFYLLLSYFRIESQYRHLSYHVINAAVSEYQ